MSKVILTGSNGFVGRALLGQLLAKSHQVTALVRNDNYVPVGSEQVIFGELSALSVDTAAFEHVDVIIHCAARAHILKDNLQDPLAAFRQVNVDGTLDLAKMAAANGVKRFIFISSIGVNGNLTQSPFTIEDQPAPWDDYSRSKLEAEEGLKALCSATGMEYVILRPPLVYGANAPGNFGKLVKAVMKGLPLPLGAIHNQRSLVALDNLIDLIMNCLEHPKAVNQTFLVSDDQDVSTTELLQKVAYAFGKKTKLLPIPMSWIQRVASLLGNKAVADRLCGSLQVDITHTKEMLGWKPPVTMDQQLAKIAASMQSSVRDV